MNELNSEVETVQEEVGSIKADMNSFQNEESMTQTSRKDTLKKIEVTNTTDLFFRKKSDLTPPLGGGGAWHFIRTH